MENNKNFEFLRVIINSKIMLPFFEEFENDTKKSSYDKLGNGYELRPIEMYDKKGVKIINNNNYSHLYHNDQKLSNEVFRRGGLGGDFKDGYCELIHYTKEKNPKKSDNGFSFGKFVIIDNLGNIVIGGGQLSIDHPHHIGGHIASMGDKIYDLRTKTPIMIKSSSMITAKNSIIVEHRYSWYDKENLFPVGIYKIDFNTAEVIKIDDIK